MMIDGFVRVAAVTPDIKVGDTGYNADRIDTAVRAAADKGARLIVLPELSITGYTCGDLFLQDTLLNRAKIALVKLVKSSEGREEVVVVGLPLAHKGKLYNVAAVYSDGELHAFVPKSHLPNYGEFYELRHFTPAFSGIEYVSLSADVNGNEDDEDAAGMVEGQDFSAAVLSIYGDDDEDDDDYYEEDEGYYDDIPFGTDIVFKCEQQQDFSFSIEICEDLWAPCPPSVRHTAAGAAIIANLSAGNETIGKASYRRLLTCSQSGRLICGYIYANAGLGESTQDMVFSGHSVIAENGSILAENSPFGSNRGGIVLSDIDLRGLAHDRRYNNSFVSLMQSSDLAGSYHSCGASNISYEEILFSQEETLQQDSYSSRSAHGHAPESVTHAGRSRSSNVIPFGKPHSSRRERLYRYVDAHPFVPSGIAERSQRCDEILEMQSSGLAGRLAHTGAKVAVLGVSGGLDSTLALLVSVRAMKMIGKGADSVLAVTMPGFGTTSKTKDNAKKLATALGVTLREIEITKQTKAHLKSIGQKEDDFDVTFENAQARIRTLILMDLANKEGGIVVGTGDLSELALGWATFNGDHMSMYGVNSGVPKSLVRHIIRYAAESADRIDLVDHNDVIDTNAGMRESAGEELSGVLYDILDTPVSPELLPPEEGDISQKTEEIIGPYELHDFFLYHVVRWGRGPKAIYELAKIAFAGAGNVSELQNAVGVSEVRETVGSGSEHKDESAVNIVDRNKVIVNDAKNGIGVYTDEEILKWLKIFIRRFFANQFKRSTLPDGPKIGSVTLSPRADWRMPPDAKADEWLKELE